MSGWSTPQAALVAGVMCRPNPIRTRHHHTRLYTSIFPFSVTPGASMAAICRDDLERTKSVRVFSFAWRSKWIVQIGFYWYQ
ncbi:hypothetical protein IF2G_01033 [Cordyceps javanica]|nr:hypothetical protein IF2G_01033 [Cordyceps javanica]